jgi:hypothetical protein
MLNCDENHPPKNKKVNDLVIVNRLKKYKMVGKSWKTDLIISEYELTSLIGCPIEIIGNFLCSTNKLTSLNGGPTFVKRSYNCSYNNLSSLEGCANSCSSLFCQNNELTSLEHCPKKLKFLRCDSNLITNLHDIHRILPDCASINLRNNPLDSHILGLLKIKNLCFALFDNKGIEDIINKYLPLGDILACQEELMEAGYEEFAQL